MSEPHQPPSLNRAREQKINELSTHFANDDLSLDDLERRIERVYKATSVADLELITADLRASAPLVDPRALRAGMTPLRETPLPRRGSEQSTSLSLGEELPQSRLMSIMSSMRRVGRWAVPRDLRMVSVMSDTRIDLTSAALPVGGVVNIDITAVMASVRIIVPPGMRVVSELHSFMADVGSWADELDDGVLGAGTPIVRLRGSAVMADVKVKVRRRDEPYSDDED